MTARNWGYEPWEPAERVHLVLAIKAALREEGDKYEAADAISRASADSDTIPLMAMMVEVARSEIRDQQARERHRFREWLKTAPIRLPRQDRKVYP